MRVSILLTVLGVMLGMFALFGFGYIRLGARQAAMNEARSVAEENTTKYLEENLTDIVRGNLDAMRQGDMPNEDTSELAEAQGEQEGGNR